MRDNYIPPTLTVPGFNCPHCDFYARQYWYEGAYTRPNSNTVAGRLMNISVNLCEKCTNFSLWLEDKMIFPISSIAPMPTKNMSNGVKEDYLEARTIVNASPRAAAALLRLAVQKLTVVLGETGKNLDSDIGSLVKKGLPVTIQQALDCVRVIGNNAVHPGELDLKDDIDTASSLFSLINMIVDVMITQPKEVKKLFDKIPKGAKEAISKRDASISSS